MGKVGEGRRREIDKWFLDFSQKSVQMLKIKLLKFKNYNYKFKEMVTVAARY